MRRILSVVLMMALALAAPAWGKTEEITQRASGYGDTPRTATANALVEAARQALGVSVVANPNFRVATYEWMANENIAQGVWTSRPEDRAASLANVAGYQVLETTQVNDDLWQVTVEARLLRDVSIAGDRSALPTLVVMPFRTTASEYYPGVKTPAAEVRRRLHRELGNAFVQAGRVRVLDRSNNAALANEEEVVAGGLSPFEHAKLGQELGADLVLVGEVEDFKLGREKDTFYGTQMNTMEPVVRIHYQLIETATREVLRAGTFEEQRSSQLLLQKLREADIDKDREPERIGEVIYPDVARGIAGEALDALYPVRVLSAPADSTIYISQGSGRLQEGDLLSVHPPAGEVSDPDSGVTVRLESPSVGTVRVTQVADQYAIGELVTGELGSLGSNSILRVQVPVAAPQPGPGKPMTPGSSDKPVSW